jgi:H/ACA ribonucleoprotein complex non-core subunit NAF1
MINGICHSMEKSTKLYSDKLLEEINLSSDEETTKNQTQNLNTTNNANNQSKSENMAEAEYNNQMDKINEFYDEFADGSMNKYTGTKNEQEERINIPVPFEIEANTVFSEAGIVDYIFENDKILLKKTNLQNGILDLDNIIWNSNHIAVGYLDDVVGKIDEPVYIVKFFPNLTDKNLVVLGEPLFYVKDKALKVQKKDLLRKKGCDASNAFDEEVSDSGREFSDDEQEYQYKQV